MKRIIGILLILLSFAFWGLADTSSVWARGSSDEDASSAVSVFIGTGGVTGIYYPTGGAIARMINDQRDEYGIRLAVESTGGSVYNINAVLAEELEFGVAQSDRQFQAVQGLAEWKDEGPQKDLRSMFSIHPEAITLIATESSGIQSVFDLRGKRVHIGSPDSGQIQNSRDIFNAFSINESRIVIENIELLKIAEFFQDGKLDAFFYTVGHPNNLVKSIVQGEQKVRIIPIIGPELDVLLAANPYYAPAIIAIDEYPNAVNTENVNTIGVTATLITSKSVPNRIVYAITKEVFDNFEAFKQLHPAYSVLTKQNMLVGLSAPIHEGAVEYYKEAGLDSYIDPALLQ